MSFIKIILLTPYYYPIIGGITTFVHNLQQNLQKRGNSALIITNSGNDNDHAKAIVHYKYLFILKSYWYMRSQKPDVLHSHSHWYVLAPCVLYKKLHPKTRVFHTFHTKPVKRIAGFRKKLFEFLLSKCDCITFVSEDLKAKYEDLMKIKTAKKVVYSGVAIKEVHEDDKRNFVHQYDLDGCHPILSFIGPLSWRMKVEGIKRLIEAFILVKNELPNAKLLIVGDGSYRKELERSMQQKKMKDDIIFTGFVKNSFVPLSITDIYAHISLQEGFPIALLEAMSIGKPVIASKTGGIPELIIDGGNGILVNTEPEEIANKIITLYKDENKMNILGKNAQKFIQEGHLWENIALKFIDLYKGKL